jgi:hypothetical protein
MTGIVGAPGTQVTRTDGVSLGCCSVPVFARTGAPDSVSGTGFQGVRDP